MKRQTILTLSSTKIDLARYLIFPQTSIRTEILHMRNSIDNRTDAPGYQADEYLVAKADMTNIIRSIMKSRDLSVQDVAERAGLDPLQVEKIYIYRLKEYSIDDIKLVYAVVCNVEPDLNE